MIRTLARVAPALLLFVACRSEGIISPDEARALEVGRATWNSSSVRNAYRFETRQVCFCPREFAQWHTVEVRNGAVVAVTLADGTQMPEPYRDGVHTVDELFELLATERPPELRNIDMEFDRSYGYPTFVSFGYDPKLADAGLSVFARNLTPLP
jgi:hypothetical protein